MMQQTQLLHFICIPICLLGLSFLADGSGLSFCVVCDISLAVLKTILLKSMDSAVQL